MKRRYAFFAFIAYILTSLGLVSVAQAQLVVGVKGGNFKPIMIAIPEFRSSDGLGQKISQIIAADLERSGLFFPLDQTIFIDKAPSLDQKPNFANWKTIDAQGLVVGRIAKRADGRLAVEMRLWDVASSRQLLGKEFHLTPKTWRRVAHIMADAIYSHMTGETPYFNTKIVFVDETGPATKRIKRLAIMDQDGANLKYLTDGRELVVTPRFSSTAQQIAYMAYVNKKPRVYIQDLSKGVRRLVGTFPNMTIAPRFSADGKKVIMSLLRSDGNANLYTMDLATRLTKRLTSTNAIDTSASYAPSNKEIVFSSDRGGRPGLYVMDADGTNARRISQGTGSYLTPVWSPRGDYIAFTKLSDGLFSIGVMRPDGSGERILTAGFHNEGPTWAPNGRVIMFFRKQAGWPMPKIYSIDLTGRNEREVVTPNGASDPAWSGLLKD